MKTLKIGIIGAGMISHHSHAGAFQKQPDVEIAAVADLDRERGRSFAAKFDIPSVFQDYEEMLRAVDLDAVSIPLPVFMHAPATIAALNAGKHVLCEKPMARSLPEAEAMVDAARRNNRKLQVYWRNRFSAEARRARRLIEDGELGEVHYVRTIGLRWRGRPSFDPSMRHYGAWFGKKDQAGGGTLMDIGGYQIDLALGTLGFPAIQSITGIAYQGIDRERALQEGYDVEEFAAAMIRLENGCAVSLESSFASNIDGPNGTWSFGSKAGLTFQPLRLYRTDAEGKKQEETVDVSGEEAQSPVAQFVQAIREDRPIPIGSGEGALIVQRVQDAIYRSAAAGRDVTV